ncbi:MAG: M55 family metallopeptidase [Gaiellaceae bacterium MAG52_C11]|nr:M55 family metallopeptidase [Candidatus Gaiellasilicea maunaloa]
MKIFLSSDIEGAAGVVDPQQAIGAGPEYELGRQLLLGEVNAAIDGALAGGATKVVVNDSHWTMQNLRPAELAGRASYVSGRCKPLFMMEGLDKSFDAAFLVAYHGSIGAERAILAHTYDPFAVHEVALNGTVVGESAINALVALHYAVPVALVTGDEATADEARAFMPGIECVVVKRSISRFAAESLHPEAAREEIRAGAKRALARLPTLSPPAIELPARLDVTFLTADMAGSAIAIRGVERTGARAVAIEDDDALRLYRAFVATLVIVRASSERRLEALTK